MDNKKIEKLVLSLALPAVIGAGMATVNKFKIFQQHILIDFHKTI